MDKIVKKILILIKSYLKEIVFISVFCLLNVFFAFCRPLIIKEITDEGMIRKNYNIVCIFSFLLIMLILIEQILEIIKNKCLLRVKKNVIHELSVQAFDKLLHTKIAFFENENSAEIIEQLNTDIGSVGILLNQGFIYMLSYCIKIFPGLVGMFYINHEMAIFILCCIPLKWFVLQTISKREEKITFELIEKNAKLYASMADVIKGIQEVKLFNIYNKEIKKFIYKKAETLNIERKHEMLSIYNLTAENVLQGFMMGIFYLYGGYCVCNGKMSVGNVVAFISYSGFITGSIAMIMNTKLVIAQIKPSFKRLSEFFEMETEKSGEAGCPQDIEILRVDHLEFGYNEKVVLDDVAFKVKRGEKIAIIGENGSGKSTLLQILLRLYVPQKGEIFLDTEKAKDINLEKYRAQFSVVSQFPYFFQETVRANLDPNGEHDDQDIIEVFRELKMMDVYNALEHGLDTKIGVDSTNLSGGERQKLALARAVLKNSPIFIFDECTSNYDSKSEEWLYTQWLDILHEKKVIFVTHQTKYLKYFDKIYMLTEGKMKQVQFGFETITYSK